MGLLALWLRCDVDVSTRTDKKSLTSKHQEYEH